LWSFSNTGKAENPIGVGSDPQLPSKARISIIPSGAFGSKPCKASPLPGPDSPTNPARA
jgi:hypothetical protein